MESGGQVETKANGSVSHVGNDGIKTPPEMSEFIATIRTDDLAPMKQGKDMQAQESTGAHRDGQEFPAALHQDAVSASKEPEDSGLIDNKSDVQQDSQAVPVRSKSSPVIQRRPQSASPSSRPLSASQDLTYTRSATVPEPFRFSTDGRMRRLSEGAIQLNPGSAKRRLRSPSHTAPSPTEDSKGTPPVRKTMPKPFNLEGMKRHEKALEQLKAEIAAKEAEENAPRSFRARPILKPEAAPATRVIAPPTKPSAFKLSVEDRAERRDKFKKKVEDRERQEETEREKMLHELKEELDKEEKQVRRKTSFKAAPARITPDDKVFKPKLGQTPKTEPQAPTLGPKRRKSTDAQEEITPDPNASPVPGASPKSTRPPSNRVNKTPSPNANKASPRVGKPVSPDVVKTPVKTPSKTPSKSPSKPPPEVPSKTPVKTPSPGPIKPGRVTTAVPKPPLKPDPKPAPNAVKTVSPRLYKPVAPKSEPAGQPGAGQAPSPLQKKAPGSSPASPRPPSATAHGPPKRRSSEGSGSPRKPPGSGVGTPSPSLVARSPIASTAKQTPPRPVSAKGAGNKSPGGISPRKGARPGSASAEKAKAGEKKTTPRKVVPGKGPDKSPKIEEKQMDTEEKKMDLGVMKEMVVENGAIEEVSAEKGGELAASIEEPLSEPPATPELGTDKKADTEEGGKVGEVVDLITTEKSGKENESSAANGVEPKGEPVAKVESNGVANGGTDEALLDTVLVQFDQVLTTGS